MSSLRIAYVPLKFPVLTQTFIQREVKGLLANGLDVKVHPLLGIEGGPLAPGLEGVDITYLKVGELVMLPWRVLQVIVAHPHRVAQGVGLVLRHPPQAREFFLATLWGALFGLVLAARLRRVPCDLIHAAWAAAPATAAAVAAALTKTPFSFGAHAYDVHRHGGDPLLVPKMKAARFVHTTTTFNVAHLSRLVPEARVVLARRGLPGLPSLPERTGMEGRPVRLLSVGRLVAKKGHCHQLAACAELRRRGVPFELRMAGDGPDLEVLKDLAEELGVHDRVLFLGARTQEQINGLYAWADVFWHTGVVDGEGDRDGLPNVIPEAMAHGLPVISSNAGGAGEAVQDGETGLVVDVADLKALAGAVERVRSDETLRRRLASSGRVWVEAHFLAVANTGLIAAAMREAVDKPGGSDRLRQG
jgi:colanic acid/amylovoran biosynthesis glycosyltransferase